jgi:hypothetical protein
MSYLIRNEDGEVMRIVGRQEESQAICALRKGWTYKSVRKIVRKIMDGYKFEDALF